MEKYEKYFRDTSIFGPDIDVLNNNFLFTKPIFRIGANYEFREKNFVRASIGQSFRMPSIAERFVDENITDDFAVFSNPQILPEQGYTVEFGYKRTIPVGKNWKGYFDAATFYQQFKPMVEFQAGIWERYGHVDPNTGETETGLGFSAVNVAKARIFGYEFTAAGDGTFGKNKIPLSILAGYTYSFAVDANENPEYEKFGNVFKNSFKGFKVDEEQYESYESAATRSESIIYGMLSYRFRHLLKLDIESGYKKFSYGTSVRYYSYIDKVDEVFNVFIPGFDEYRQGRNFKGEVVWDIRTGYKLSENFKLNLIVKNVTNRLYVIRPSETKRT